MKTNTKLIAAAAAVLAAGLLSQNAKAGAVVGLEYDANLTEMTLETGPVNYQGQQFTLRSSATPGTGAFAGDYLYWYSFGTPTQDPNKLAPPVGIASASVYFDTAGTGAFNAAVAGPFGTPQIVAIDVNWTFAPNGEVESFGFYSPDAPGFGSASAQNGGLWQQTSGNVVVPIVPAVPDTATTLSLLGGAVVGLGALRRKIGC